MRYQEDRLRRIALFEDTIQYCERNQSLVNAVLQTRRDTVLYRNPLEECRETSQNRYGQPCMVFQSQACILETAQKLHLQHPDCRIGILNNASAVNPGGDVIRGGKTQEAYLCSCSTLYPCLNTTELLQAYYNSDRKNISYADVCIYTPNVVCIRTDTGRPEKMKESDWFSVDVISCTVPDLEECLQNVMNLWAEENELAAGEGSPALLRKQMKGILQVAARNDIGIFLLGVPDGKSGKGA